MQDDFILPEGIRKDHGKGCLAAVRLAARIHNLRSKGIPIKTDIHEYKNTAGNKVRYAIYSLEVSNA